MPTETMTASPAAILRWVRKQIPLFNFLCATVKIPGVMESDSYVLHFHHWGRLRPWKNQYLLEACALNRVAVITRLQVYTLITRQPMTFTAAICLLRSHYDDYEFTFFDNRFHHDN